MKLATYLSGLAVSSGGVIDYSTHGSAWSTGVCATGQSQSPINIITSDATVATDFEEFELVNYDKALEWKLENTGHGIKLSTYDNSIKMKGGHLGSQYILAQFHFHWGSDSSQGSEHRIDGTQHWSEVHFVHFKDTFTTLGDAVASDESDALAVLGYFLDVDNEADEGALDFFIDELVGNKVVPYDHTTHEDIWWSANHILDLDGLDDFYRYQGGLTTPTCNEIVTWTVFNKPITITEATKQAMRDMADTDTSGSSLELNFRNPQSINGREITLYKKSNEIAAPVEKKKFETKIAFGSLPTTVTDPITGESTTVMRPQQLFLYCPGGRKLCFFQ